MIPLRVTFTVDGRPEPRREPPIGTRGPYTNAKNAVYYERVRWAWRAAGAVRFDHRPLRLDVLAVFPRPKKHWRADGSLSPEGARSAWHTGTPDRSNILKAIEDALQGAGLAFENDSQVVAGEISKVWATEPGDNGEVIVTLTEMVA